MTLINTELQSLIIAGLTLDVEGLVLTTARTIRQGIENICRIGRDRVFGVFLTEICVLTRCVVD